VLWRIYSGEAVSFSETEDWPKHTAPFRVWDFYYYYYFIYYELPIIKYRSYLIKGIQT